MSTETRESKPRTEEQISFRNELQRIFLEKAINDGFLNKEEDFNDNDFIKMTKMFEIISDIIDSNEQSHESIRVAYENGDYDGAARMLLTLDEIKSL